MTCIPWIVAEFILQCKTLSNVTCAKLESFLHFFLAGTKSRTRYTHTHPHDEEKLSHEIVSHAGNFLI